MSNLTANDTRGLMKAYAAVHDPEIRANLEEEQNLVEEIGLQMIENASYVLFSQGYDVEDVISYFTEAAEDTIVEDYVNYSEGRVLLESVAVSDAYIEEQFEILNEGLLDFAARQGGRLLQAGKNIKNALTPAAKAPVKNYNSPLTTTLAQGSRPPGAPAPSAGKPNLLQRAAKGAKDLVMRIPGAVKKLGGKALPGVGAALYGMDAVNRAKKGDWGGAALSGLGAATSFAGPIAALAPAGIQMATDALGLTGDKSKKGPAAKTAPSKPPSLKAKQDYAKSKGKYYSSSDQKTYKNYNDALAARNSRLGKKPAPVAPPPAPSAPAKPQQPKPAKPQEPKLMGGPEGSGEIDKSSVEKDMQSFKPRDMSKNPLKPETSQGAIDATTKPVDNVTPAQQQIAKSSKSSTALTQDQIRKQRLNMGMEYDAYDLVLEYLFGTQQVSTVDEAHYVMLEMDSQMIQAIVEEMTAE